MKIYSCTELRLYIEREVTKLRQPVPVEAEVASNIWKLGTNLEYCTIAALFGLGQSTICEIELDNCEVIVHHLMPKYVCVPQNECLRCIINGFQCRWGFLQTLAAINGTHILILPPKESGSDNYSQKGYHSTLMHYS